MTSLKVSAIFPATPVQSSGSRTVKSPRLKATNALKSSRLSHSPFPECAPWVRVRRREEEVVFFMNDKRNDRDDPD
jgi:hypothetical protein